MSEKNRWQFELEEYIRQGEPSRTVKSEAWQAAIGLQQVDGLKTSGYLLENAKDHIEGKIDIKEVQRRIYSYYKESTDRKKVEDGTMEADIVSSRIAELLGEKAFRFSSVEYLNIHRRLFEGVFEHAGQVRSYNITKDEWVLNGGTVIYASFDSIKNILEYDFQTESHFSYQGLSMAETVEHLAKFAANIWQIHPFCEGNTRTTAVFLIKYMKTLGFEVKNDAFQKNSWYFRNALVRANFNDLKKGIHATTQYLELFFSNLLLGTNFELKNRHLHVGYSEDLEKLAVQSAEEVSLKGKNYTLSCTLDELNILKILVNEPAVTQVQLSERLNKSLRTVKNNMAKLKEKGYIKRINGKKFGYWEVLVEL